jgi:hypothetical protein
MVDTWVLKDGVVGPGSVTVGSVELQTSSTAHLVDCTGRAECVFGECMRHVQRKSSRRSNSMDVNHQQHQLGLLAVATVSWLMQWPL